MNVYQTTLSRRTHNLTSQDFEGVANLDPVLGSDIKLWNKFIPFTPEQIRTIFTTNLSVNPSLDIYFAKHELLVVKIRPQLMSEYGYLYRPGGYDVEAHYDVHRGRMNSVSHIKLSEEMRGSGLGRQLSRGLMEFALALDFNEFSFGMALGNGAYTWSRMGAYMRFDTYEDYIEMSRANSADQLITRLDIVKDHISPSVYERAWDLCQLHNKDDLIRLVEMNDILLPASLMEKHEYDDPSMVRDGFEKLGKPVHGEMGIEKELDRIVPAFKFAAKNDMKGPSLPMYLLAGTTHDAYVDFSDDEQMEIVGRYLGGWETIAPVGIAGLERTDQPRLVL